MLVLPFKGLYKLSQEFGVNPERYSQFIVMYPDGVRRPMKGHNGLDFACPYRTEIIAPHDGAIIEANLDAEGYGYYVKIENEKEGSVLAHLDTIDVKVGYQMKQGDHLGWSDSTGNSTGNHLHWGYYRIPRDRNNGLAGFEDQTEELKASGIIVTLGELPIVANQTPVLSESDKVYKGIDLTNIASVRAAIDAWHDVANGQYVTKDTYNTLATEHDLVLKQLASIKESLEEYEKELKEYTLIKTAGYPTLKDIETAMTKDQEELQGARKQVIDLGKDNKELHDMLARKEEQDYTTVESGVQAREENKQLKETVTGVTQAVGAEKPSLSSILDKVLIFKSIAEKVLDAKQQAYEKKAEKLPGISTPREPFWDSFLKFLTLPQEEKGVKTK